MEKTPKRQIVLTLDEGDEIIEREIKKFGGNAGHVILPSKHIGKKALIVVAEKINRN